MCTCCMLRQWPVVLTLRLSTGTPARLSVLEHIQRCQPSSHDAPAIELLGSVPQYEQLHNDICRRPSALCAVSQVGASATPQVPRHMTFCKMAGGSLQSKTTMAGCRITPVLVFWTLPDLHWVKFTSETGFELPSSWVDLPCYGLNLNRNILDFMK
jgi:hypothetical protein